MTAADVIFIRDTFKLSQRDLAKSLNIAPYTVARWESGISEPAGLQAEVLRALFNTATEISQRQDTARAQTVGGLIALGIGALIFYLLSSKR